MPHPSPSRARRRIIGMGLPAVIALATASCAPPGPSGVSSPPPVSSPSAPSVTDNTWTDAINPTAIPLGDGKVSGVPRVGYVDSCTANFRAGGAEHSGPWINSRAGTWNTRTKPTVPGRHTWPDATYRVSVRGATRVITTADLPVGSPTGSFPISPSDPAYAYDHNPNSVIAHPGLTFAVPASPTRAATPSCTGLGPIGVTSDGVLLFNALDAAGRDAGAHEIQDSCDGHPDGQQEYHYHSISSCLMSPKPDTSVLVGYALDGYGIYAEWNATGNLPTDADLDACHGRTSTVLWDGKPRAMYHYDVTLEYPYTVGCFRGTPIQVHPGQP